MFYLLWFICVKYVYAFIWVKYIKKHIYVNSLHEHKKQCDMKGASYSSIKLKLIYEVIQHISSIISQC